MKDMVLISSWAPPSGPTDPPSHLRCFQVHLWSPVTLNPLHLVCQVWHTENHSGTHQNQIEGMFNKLFKSIFINSTPKFPAHLKQTPRLSQGFPTFAFICAFLVHRRLSTVGTHCSGGEAIRCPEDQGQGDQRRARKPGQV